MEGVSKEPSGDAIRSVMRRVPSSVTVVVVGGAEPRGITIGSFVTVSLDPPLVSFNVQHSARIHDELGRDRRFAVHVLAAGQERISDIFADPDLTGMEQLGQVDDRLDGHGVPVIPGAIARFACTVEAVYPGGDHSIILGRALELDSGAPGEALLYLNRSYRSVES